MLYLLTTLVLNGKKMCVDENIAGYLKNHWTKHRLVCTLSDTFFMLMPNIGMIFYNSEIFENFLGKN